MLWQQSAASPYRLYRSHNTMSPPTTPPASLLPDPFRFTDGTPVVTFLQWKARRDEIAAAMLPLLYGAMPPAPAATTSVVLHEAVARRFHAARLLSCRVLADDRHAFLLRVYVPAAQGRHPVVLHGDGCWHHARDEVIAEVVDRGHAFAQFNRLEVAPDVADRSVCAREQARLFGTATPEGGFGALAAWAWAYHRAVDVLQQQPFVRADAIAVVGHSRGGKAALLAGATDTRIAVTSANNSGAGGAGCWRWQAQGVERLSDITTAFPHWFGPELPAWAGREDELPFDQHFLKALVAPRALLCTEALGDTWANPVGTWQTQRAAQEVFRFLGEPERIAVRYRAGGHDHAPEDWRVLLDFLDAQLQGQAGRFPPQEDPYPGLAPAHTWHAPTH
jgi:dienelactone hydrolase